MVMISFHVGTFLRLARVFFYKILYCGLRHFLLTVRTGKDSGPLAILSQPWYRIRLSAFYIVEDTSDSLKQPLVDRPSSLIEVIPPPGPTPRQRRLFVDLVDRSPRADRNSPVTIGFEIFSSHFYLLQDMENIFPRQTPSFDCHCAVFVALV